MPQLNWDRFNRLDGDPATNWERLCTDVLRRTYTPFGTFEAYSQHPGVEIMLHLQHESPTLGIPPRTWGWQCRWYELQGGQRIGTNRRISIEQAIQRTEKRFPATTDWVLWTKRPLTPTDQDWFRGLSTSMDLHLWTEDDLAAHFVGDAELLRETYFGDLIFSPTRLRDLRSQSIAHVRRRWLPEAHVSITAEQTIRRVLGELEYWPEVVRDATALHAPTQKLAALNKATNDGLRQYFADLYADLESLSTKYADIVTALSARNLTEAIQEIETAFEPRTTRASARRFTRELRRRRSRAALDVCFALAYHQDAVNSLERLRNLLSTKMIAIVGPAGCGKTHLSLELSADSNTEHCGIFLEASRLSHSGTFQDLFRWQIDRPLEDVLEGVESAAVRAGIRVPVIIDGLSESEDPALWARELASLQVILERFRHVVMIVTTRPQIADDAVPEGCAVLKLEGFGELTPDAVKKYFKHYRIDPSNVRFPISLFQNPLLLRMFCEATNPDRQILVSPESVPASLLDTFARFRRTAAKRIAIQPGRMRRYDQDILKVIDICAIWLWDHRSRSIPLNELRSLISDEGPDWDNSLVRALRDEGIVTFFASNDGSQRVAFLYDGLGGFIIADALIRTIGKSDFAQWIKEATTLSSLGCSTHSMVRYIRRFTELVTRWLPVKLQKTIWRFARIYPDLFEAHPLAADIRAALTGLLPRRFRTQFWQHLEGEMREEAIINAAKLERSLLDSSTIDEIARVAMVKPSRHRVDLFSRFHELHDSIDHPLNADFVTEILCRQTVAARDLRWSEWIRDSRQMILADFRRRIADWKSRSSRTKQDHLQAAWIKWTLTSTVRDLRDQATYALYCYGRGDPGSLFRLTVSSLAVNDPYVAERLLAATYGVVMAAPGDSRELATDLEFLLDELHRAFCTNDARTPTYHWLIREYVLEIIEIVRYYYQDCLGQLSNTQRLSSGIWPQAIESTDSRNSDGEMIYGLDFANYTIGGLIPGRGAYNYENPEYQEVLSWIRGRVWDLGWRHREFATIERRITDDRNHYLTRPGRIDAYLKKYGWIGFFESAGRLQDTGRTPLLEDEYRLAEVDIDPSFPVVARLDESTFTGWLPDNQYDAQTWVTSGVVKIDGQCFRQDRLKSQDGPWLVLSGYLSQEDIESRRKVFGFLHAILTKSESAEKLKDALIKRDYPGNNWIPRAPGNYYIFAGELPWSRHARRALKVDELAGLYAGTIILDTGDEIAVEIPVHDYDWESYHSTLNGAGGHTVPAITLAQEFDLRAMPESLDWCDRDGRVASLTMRAPQGFEHGDLLYIREDLLLDYCEKRGYELIWIAWGEREAWFADVAAPKPDWVTDAYSNHANIWRRVISLSRVAFGSLNHCVLSTRVHGVVTANTYGESSGVLAAM